MLDCGKGLCQGETLWYRFGRDGRLVVIIDNNILSGIKSFCWISSLAGGFRESLSIYPKGEKRHGPAVVAFVKPHMHIYAVAKYSVFNPESVVGSPHDAPWRGSQIVAFRSVCLTALRLMPFHRSAV